MAKIYNYQNDSVISREDKVIGTNGDGTQKETRNFSIGQISDFIAAEINSSPDLSSSHYKGNWNAATNTPTLNDSTGNIGDYYRCIASGIFSGIENVNYNIGDIIQYDGTKWFKSSENTILYLGVFDNLQELKTTFPTASIGSYAHIRRINQTDVKYYYEETDGWVIDNYQIQAQEFTSKLLFCLSNNISNQNIIILSDSTGDQNGEWAWKLTEYLVAQFPEVTVKFKFWDIGTSTYQPTQILQTGTASVPIELNIYLGGASGQGLAYANSNFNILFVAEPNLVLVSYGHNDNYASTELYLKEYYKLTKTITNKYINCPLVLVGQNPKAPDQTTFLNGIKNVSDIMQLCANEGYGFINVMQRFFDYGDYTTLLTDGIHPNSEGSKLWFDAVKESFVNSNYSNFKIPYKKDDSIFISANEINTDSTKGIDSNNITYIILNNIVSNKGTMSVNIPTHWKKINTYVIWKTPTDSTSTKVVFNGKFIFLDDEQSLPQVGFIEYTPPNGATANKVIKSHLHSGLQPWGLTEYELEIKNKPTMFIVERMGSNAEDTYTSEAHLYGIVFERRS